MFKRVNELIKKTQKKVKQQTKRIKWILKKNMIIAHWLNIKNFKIDATNKINDYFKNVKINVIKKIWYNFKFDAFKLETKLQKFCEKITTMMKNYKNNKIMIDTTNWKIDFIKHDHIFDDQNHENVKIIRQILLKRCFWYYEFENFINDKFNVISIFLSEFEQLNRRNLMFINEFDSKKADAFYNDNLNETQFLFNVVDDSTTNKTNHEKINVLSKKETTNATRLIKIVALNMKFLLLQINEVELFNDDFIQSQQKSIFKSINFASISRSQKNKIVVKKQKKKIMKKRIKFETNSKFILSNFEHERNRKKLKKTFKTRNFANVFVKIEKKKIIQIMKRNRLIRQKR